MITLLIAGYIGSKLSGNVQMTKTSLEKYQVLIYISAILLGLSWGIGTPAVASVFERLLWPVLAFLLYTTFTQASLSRLKQAFRDVRFLAVALTGNFVLIPLVVWGIVSVMPDQPAIRLGVALVLLVPCTDWFITFTQLGGGETERAIAFSPLSLLFQMLLLPFYLFLFFGNEQTISLASGELLLAFTGIILLPLIAAYFTDKWATGVSGREQYLSFLGWFPVPLLAFVIFSIALSQAHILLETTSLFWYPVMGFAAFLILAIVLAKTIASVVSLPVRQGRVLAFSFGSRNSFVVLPLVLALPESYEIAVFVVVLQSLVELFGMIGMVWLVPYLFFKTKSHSG